MFTVVSTVIFQLLLIQMNNISANVVKKTLIV